MKNKVIIIIIIVLVLAISLFSYFKMNKKETLKEEPKSVAQIKGYDYLLFESDLELYKEEFFKLKDNLESNNIDYLEYAKSISNMFLIDLYDLNSKKNMYDVGGIEFVYPEARDNYALNVSNTLYKYMEDINSRKNQKLPSVKSVSLEDVSEISFDIKDKQYNGYKIHSLITYKEDLGYDTDVEVILIKDNNYIYVVEKN